MNKFDQSLSCDKEVAQHRTNKEAINIFSQRLHDNLHAYYPNLDKNKTTIIGKPLGGQFAKTFRFVISSVNLRYYIFIKICPLFESLDPAKMEYDTLRLLYNNMQMVADDLAVPRPIDYFPDLNAYAMESVGTKDFRTYLLKNNSKLRGDGAISELLDKISGCARWLSAFHGNTMTGKRVEFNGKAFVDSFEEEFNYRELRDFRFPRKTIDMLDSLMERLSYFSGKLNMPCAKWHWDYTPGHVYLDHDKISVIDILGIDDTPIYEDIGHFLAALTSINNLPFYPFFDYKRACFTLCDRFMDAYISDAGYEKKEFILLVNIYRLKYLIVYFIGQYRLVSQKTHPFIGKAFANYWIVNLFQGPLLHTMKEITILISETSGSDSV